MKSSFTQNTPPSDPSKNYEAHEDLPTTSSLSGKNSATVSKTPSDQALSAPPCASPAPTIQVEPQPKTPNPDMEDAKAKQAASPQYTPVAAPKVPARPAAACAGPSKSEVAQEMDSADIPEDSNIHAHENGKSAKDPVLADACGVVQDAPEVGPGSLDITPFEEQSGNPGSRESGDGCDPLHSSTQSECGMVGMKSDEEGNEGDSPFLKNNVNKKNTTPLSPTSPPLPAKAPPTSRTSKMGRSVHDKPPQPALLSKMPKILRDETERLMKTLSMSEIGAALTTINAFSCVLQKGPYLVSQKQKVHPNIFTMYVAESGAGKKMFFHHEPKIMELFKIEQKKAQINAMKAREELKELKKISAKEDTPLSTERLMDLQDKSRIFAFFGTSDITGPYIARTLAMEQQGGYFAMMCDEGSQLFNRINPRSQDDSISIFIKGYNDLTSGLARVDERDMTNDTVSNPRLALTMAIQPGLLHSCLMRFPIESGFLQRFHYYRSCSPIKGDIADTMFCDEDESTPASTPFENLLETCVPLFIAGSNSFEISLSDSSKEAIRVFVREYLKQQKETTDEMWKGFLSRRVEQLLKLNILFHAAEVWDGKNFDTQKQLEPVTVCMAAAFLEVIFKETEIFYEEFFAPLVAGRTAHRQGGKPTVEKVFQKALELYLNPKNEKKALLVHDIRQHYKSGPGRIEVEEFHSLVTANPHLFKWVGAPGERGSRIEPLVDGLEQLKAGKTQGN